MVFHVLDLLAPFAMPPICDGEIGHEALDEPSPAFQHQWKYPGKLLQYVAVAQNGDSEIVVLGSEV